MPRASAGAGSRVTGAVRSSKTVSAQLLNMTATILTNIREGSPFIVLEALNALAADGHLLEMHVDEQPEIEEAEMLENDSEIGFDDEDATDYDGFEVVDRRGGGEIRLKGDDAVQEEMDDALYENDCFEVRVEDGVAAMVEPAWAGSFRAKTGPGKKVISEIDARLQVFRAITDWLNSDRGGFLKGATQEAFWLTLGPGDFEELEQGIVTITQQQFIKHINERFDMKIEESCFSRYINACMIKWPDGGMPLRNIFSKEARMGWVARGVMLFMQKYGVDAEALRPDIAVPRGYSFSGRMEALDLDGFIKYASSVSMVAWKDVFTNYFKGGDREQE